MRAEFRYNVILVQAAVPTILYIVILHQPSAQSNTFQGKCKRGKRGDVLFDPELY